MKKILIATTIIIMSLFILTSCESKKTDVPILPNNNENSPTPSQSEIPVIEYNRMAMIEGRLYMDSNEESDLTGRCGNMDGQILSTVDISEIPYQNNQSNFGKDYDYQRVNEDSLDINIDGTWIRFNEILEDSWGIKLTAKEVSNTGLIIDCSQSDGILKGELTTGSYYKLEKKTENGWEELDVKESEGELAWTSEAWIIPNNDTVEWKVDWTWLYGELSTGEYRIVKDITLNDKEQSYSHLYSADFNIK